MQIFSIIDGFGDEYNTGVDYALIMHLISAGRPSVPSHTRALHFRYAIALDLPIDRSRSAKRSSKRVWPAGSPFASSACELLVSPSHLRRWLLGEHAHRWCRPFK